MTEKPQIAVSQTPQGATRIHIQKLSDVEREEIHWLWRPYIPAGKLTILEGDPGLGKSWITCSLAADISRGRPLPGQQQAAPPQKVLMLSAEDGAGDTLRPRIEAMDGDLTKIFVSDEYFVLDKTGIRELEDLMRQVAATIVFIDPIVSYMGGNMDMNKANETRAMFAPLAAAAKATGTAMVVVRHLRKSKGESNAKYSGIGSIDITAAVRSGLQVRESKNGTRYIKHFKSNLHKEGESLAYAIEGDRLVWKGSFYEDESERAYQRDREISTVPFAQAEAERFLFDYLRDGPRLSKDVIQAASLARVSKRTLDRAKANVAVSMRLPDGQWVWALRERVTIDGMAVAEATDEDRKAADAAMEEMIRLARERMGARQ